MAASHMGLFIMLPASSSSAAPPLASSSSGSVRARWSGWRLYLLLAQLAVVILLASWFAASIAAAHEASWFPVLLVGVVIVLGCAIIWGIMQMRRQLASHLNVETALRQAATFQQALEASTAGGLRARDQNGRITYVSPSFCRMTGFSSEELLGARFPAVPYWNPSQAGRNLETFNRIRDSDAQSCSVEVSMRRKNGQTFDALIIESPFIDASGRRIGWLGAVIDITEQKRAREQAQQQYERLQATSRLVTMGEMASTMAHELNQPLTAISSYVAGCLNQLEAGQIDIAELKEIQHKIARQTQRAAGIISRVHAFVRRTEPNFSSVDLNSLVREAACLIETNAQRQQVRIVCELGENLPRITVDTQMIEQIIVNLMRNGIDAMCDTPPKKRVLTIATHARGNHVVLRVSDRGCGISPDVAAHLFDPFFTTKGKGMGMGLNICRTIAELHHGQLTFESNPFGGATFTLALYAHTE
ncbi:MAG: PAS domain S-box protein [Azoarcus sp.]|jgi:two-component system sensor histidine kinase DctS|nr:PAS domain S-box protein [Azoarcus sp.]